MAKATFKGTIIAESDAFEVVEGNVYFPHEALVTEHLQPSDHTSRCPWKGLASYYDVVVDGEVLKDAAWYYPKPTILARKIAGHVAFWKGVEVTR